MLKCSAQWRLTVYANALDVVEVEKRKVGAQIHEKFDANDAPLMEPSKRLRNMASAYALTVGRKPSQFILKQNSLLNDPDPKKRIPAHRLISSRKLQKYYYTDRSSKQLSLNAFVSLEEMIKRKPEEVRSTLSR